MQVWRVGQVCSIYPETTHMIERYSTPALCMCVYVCVCVCVCVCVHRYYDRDLHKNNNRHCPLVLKTEGKLETSTTDFFLIPVATDCQLTGAPHTNTHTQTSWAESSQVGCIAFAKTTDPNTCRHTHTHTQLAKSIITRSSPFACFWRQFLLRLNENKINHFEHL